MARRRKCTVNTLRGSRACNGRGVPTKAGAPCGRPRCSAWYCDSCYEAGRICLLCGEQSGPLSQVAKMAK